MMDKHQELIERYRHHPPTERAIGLHEQVRIKHLELAMWLEANLPESREKSLAQTSLQTSAMWSNGAVAIHVSGQDQR